MTLVVLLTLLHMISGELLLVEGGFPCQDCGNSNGVGPEDEC